MLITALTLAALAAALHVFIFALESLLWTTPKARGVFGMSADEAQATREMAFNQGFYNLFLAIVTVIGVVLTVSGNAAAGIALVFAGAGSMAAAALVLFARSAANRPAAIKQGTLPLLAVIALLFAL